MALYNYNHRLKGQKQKNKFKNTEDRGSRFRAFKIKCVKIICLLCSYTPQSGLIHTEDEAYFMEPVPIYLHNRVTTNGRSKPHIIYRRSAALDHRQKLHIAKVKREIHTCGTEGKDGFTIIFSD